MNLPEEVWKDVKQRLVDRQTMLGISDMELSRRCGVTQTTISSLKAGRMGSPTLRTFTKWARGLRMTPKIGIVLDCAEYVEPYFADITPED